MVKYRPISHLQRAFHQWFSVHNFSFASSGLPSAARSRPPFDGYSIPASAFRSYPNTTLHRPSSGVRTPAPAYDRRTALSRCPFQFETGYSGCSLGPSRPLPPPFSALPSTSFSDPLTSSWTNLDSRGGRQHLVRGVTNGDDALLAARNYIGVNDGVGAWKGKELGHAALWSRLMLHFWVQEVEDSINRLEQGLEEGGPDTVKCLQRAYEETVNSTTLPTCNWRGTTTSVTALLYHTTYESELRPALYVTNIGDSQLLVIRPSTRQVLFRTIAQYHGIDCPRQLGTQSPDRPQTDAVATALTLNEDDIVIAISDGVVDNLWEHEILAITLDALDEYNKWLASATAPATAARMRRAGGPMVYIARKILDAARNVAFDPSAESPYMEKAMDRGVLRQGGKEDDISVVVARCRKRGLEG
ncbi:Protein phosphatase 2C-like protein [Ascosphaera apis ARSEF 7405]|uniref:Protein phosphatase n=1 Tax=Ascosphaera apis ARSEF 7405 TaxID=392613 RepID=A0A167UY56_9EURO|nr:Protein phosphatase 2C-like protein [Ascosphaera apis ARSEF 7405]